MNSYCVSGAAGAPQAKGTRSIDKSNGEANAQVHRAKQGVKHSIKCHLINTPRSSININQRMMKLGLGFKAHSRRVIHCRDQLVFFLSSSFFLSLFLSIFCWFLFLVTVVLWEGSPVEQIYIYIYIYFLLFAINWPIEMNLSMEMLMYFEAVDSPAPPADWMMRRGLLPTFYSWIELQLPEMMAESRANFVGSPLGFSVLINASLD